MRRSHDNSPRGNHPHQSYSGPYVGRRGKLWAGINGAPKQTQELARLRSALLKRNRGTREPCVIPDKLLYRVDVGNDGALAVSFSHSGHVLASKFHSNFYFASVLALINFFFFLDSFDSCGKNSWSRYSCGYRW